MSMAFATRLLLMEDSITDSYSGSTTPSDCGLQHPRHMKYPEFARRFRQAVEHAGAPTSQKELGVFLGVSGTMAWNYLNGEKMPGMPNATKMAGKLGVNVDWLLTGRGPMEAGAQDPTSGGEGARTETASNVRPLPLRPSQRTIPVLSYVQAGRPKEAVDDYAPGAGMDQIPVDEMDAKELGPHTFALEVDGDSMREEFKPGEQIIVDPDVLARPGDFVVAKLERDAEVTFKKYRPRGHDDDGSEIFELVPLNQDYPTLTVSQKNPGHVVGVVVRHVRRFRR